MATCPACGADVEESASECPACSEPIEAAEPLDGETAEEVPANWVLVFDGRGHQLQMMHEALQHAGIPVVRDYAQKLESGVSWTVANPELFNYYRLYVPPDVYQRRRDEIAAFVNAVTGAGGANPMAEAEAEEDYDVRACPACCVYFHDTYTACPGCGAELVPAVEIFEAGQLEPDTVIVATGDEPTLRPLRNAFQAKGFTADLIEMEGWPVLAVELPWGELTDRTSEVEHVLRGE
jgi:predicted amidophosphoribosyltransferase